MSRYWRRRIGRHLLLAGATIVLVAAGVMLLAPKDVIWRISITSGWIGAVLLAATLVLGPLNVIRGRPNPVSFDLRRDLGIWAAILATIHTGVGLFVHLRGRPLRYFVWDRPSAHLVPLRYDALGVANWIGLGSLLVFLLLGAISNDVSVRRLGPRRWKQIQRWSYVGAVAMVLHGLVYQLALEKRTAAMVLAFVLLILGTTIAQVVGFGRMRDFERRQPTR